MGRGLIRGQIIMQVSTMSQAKRVAILIDEGVALFELGCATELFALPRPEIANWYQAEVVSLASKPLKATGGLLVQPKLVSDFAAYDMVVVPSWQVHRPVSQAMASALKSFYKAGGQLIAFCSGAFLLGSVGLLNGRRATTHWRYAAEFKSSFPATEYVDDVLYLYDGRIGCSAGSSAAIDLGIEVIRHEFGYQVANQVARRLVLAAHRSGGQSQFVETPIPKNQNNFSGTLDWAIENINSPLDVNRLADKANMTRRTFDRHFRKTLNLSPKVWLIQQRLARAKSLLESSEQNIDSVAYSSGFETPIAMRHNFRKYLKISPGHYRKQFSRIEIAN